MGFGSPGLSKVSSSFQEVGILPTLVYFPFYGLFGWVLMPYGVVWLFLALRGCLTK